MKVKKVKKVKEVKVKMKEVKERNFFNHKILFSPAQSKKHPK
jgi:hypothetical protein